MFICMYSYMYYYMYSYLYTYMYSYVYSYMYIGRPCDGLLGGLLLLAVGVLLLGQDSIILIKSDYLSLSLSIYMCIYIYIYIYCISQ